MTPPSAQPLLRPRDFALLLLSSRDLRPRQRARDQRADLAGLDLKRQLLQIVADEDPEPTQSEAVLFRAVEQCGPPFGPARAIANLIHEEWQAACISPEWVAQLLDEAANPMDNAGRSGRRKDRTLPEEENQLTAKPDKSLPRGDVHVKELPANG